LIKGDLIFRYTVFVNVYKLYRRDPKGADKMHRGLNSFARSESNNIPTDVGTPHIEVYIARFCALCAFYSSQQRSKTRPSAIVQKNIAISVFSGAEFSKHTVLLMSYRLEKVLVALGVVLRKK
jgi:hypothetical protein